jgi:predicted metal-dependent hydrolase
MTADERQATVTRACDLFNSGDYWAAHEALETVWRSIISDGDAAISDGDAAAARVWQGLIQAAAALLHQQRGNSHGVATVGRGALEKLAGPQRPDVEVETVRFHAQLERALAGDAQPPRLELRGADGELRTDEGTR